MEIKLNEKLVDYEPELPITWEELLSHLLRNFVNKKHGITSILVDKKESIKLMTETPKSLVSQNVKLIEIFSNDSETIAKKGFEKILLIIINLKKESVLTADLYREGKIKEASQNILKIINQLSPILYFVNSIEKNFQLNFSELSFSPNMSIKEKLDYFTLSFTELVSAQEKKDFIELADYLEYQFTDDLSDWEKLISLLTEETKVSSSQPN